MTIQDGDYRENVERPETAPVPIPAGCAALWRADNPVTDPAKITAAASLAADRTGRDQAVRYPDGTTVIITKATTDG